MSLNLYMEEGEQIDLSDFALRSIKSVNDFS